MRPFDYHRASDVTDAIASRGEGEATEYLAGGTTLIDLVKLDVMQTDKVIDVNRLPLDAIEETGDGGLRIGANVRNSDLAWDERVKRKYQAVSEAILSGASPQLRNMATTAGNLMQRTRCPYFRDNYSPCNKRKPGTGCAAIDGYNRIHVVLGGSEHCVATHPSDLCVGLATFEAIVIVEGKEGERKIPLADFHLLPGNSPDQETALSPGELITAVVLPPPIPGARSVYRKSRDRASYEFALASAAVAIAVEGDTIREARVALGGVGAKPWRSAEAEDALRGQRPTERTFEQAAEAALAEAQPLEYNAFKIPLARRVLKRALEDASSVRSQ